MNFSMKCLVSEDKLIAWFTVLLCAVLFVLWPLPTLGKGIGHISEVEHQLRGFSSSNWYKYHECGSWQKKPIASYGLIITSKVKY